MVVYFNTDEFEMTIELGSSDDVRTVWDSAHVNGQSADFSSRDLKFQMRKSRDNGYLELKLSDVLHYADDTLREPFKIPVTINPAQNMLYISYRKYKTWQSKTKTKYAKPGFRIDTPLIMGARTACL